MKRSTLKIIFVFFIAVFILFFTNCQRINYTSHMKDQSETIFTPHPPIKFDYQACKMSLSFKNEYQNLYDRNTILAAVETYWNQTSTVDEKSVPARVKIAGAIRENYLWLFSVFAYGVPSLFGMPVASSSADLEITMEAGGVFYKGSGFGKCYAGIYYPGDPSQCAFSKAVTAALRDAVGNSTKKFGGATFEEIFSALSMKSEY